MTSTEILIENPLNFRFATVRVSLLLVVLLQKVFLFNHFRVGCPRYAANAVDTYRIYERRPRIASSWGQEIFL
jgi:hypothetical protein